MIGLDSSNRSTLWLVFQNARRNIGSPRFLLEVRTSVVFRGALYAPSLSGRLSSGPIAPPCSGCFSAFAHATCSLSVSRSVESSQLMPAVVTRNIQSPLLWSWSGIFATGYGAVTLYRTPFQEISPVLKIRCDQSEHHISFLRKDSVWTVSRSLAVSNDIAVAFCSCSY